MKKIKEHKNLIIISFIICYSLFLVTFINKESDYFWHIKAGEYFFKHGIVFKDVFSWSVAGKYWMSHEWLFEYIMYFLKVLFGNFNMIIYILLCLIGIYLVIFKYNQESIKKNTFFYFIWMLISTILVSFIQARPHFISFLLLSITIYFLYDFINNDSKKIYFIPLITILWSNLHGGSSNLGYIFTFIFLIIGLFDFKFKKIESKRLTKDKLIKLLIVGLVSILCTAVNIHGFKMTIYPYINLADDTMINMINEWAPTSISDIMHLPFFLLSIMILILFLFSDKRIRFIDLALFGVGFILGLKSIRFWPYLYILSSFFVFDYVSEFEFNNLYSIIIIFNILLIGFFIFSFKNIYKEINYEYEFLNKEMVDKVKESKFERMFNHYDIGGELIYHDVKVFIDGRADLYSDNNLLRPYNNIVDLEFDYLAQLHKYDFDSFLVLSYSELDNYISSSNKYDLVLKSGDYSLYKKKTS